MSTKRALFLMKTSAYVCLLFSVYFLFLSCDSTVYLDFDADPMVDRRLISAILSVPLPQGIAFSDDPPNESRISIVVAVAGWEKNLPPAAEGAPGKKLLQRRWYAPIVPYDRGVFGVEELGAGNGVQMLPLDEIALPTRGLSVDGKYPGDPGYPYYEDTVIFIAAEDDQSPDEKTLAVLREWIGLLPRTTDNSDITWFAAVGDIMPGRGVSRLLSQENGLDTVLTD